LDELFDDEFELELLDELELEFDELFEEEFELELLDEFELELLDELDELLPATMTEPSLRLVAVSASRSTSIAGIEYCFASAAPVAIPAMPATRTEINLVYFVMAFTPLAWTGIGPAEERAVAGVIPCSSKTTGSRYLAWLISRSACASGPASIGASASTAER
jgi:hypothetical protein